MKRSCELLASCGYFEKYQYSKETLCKDWIRQFCQGPKMDQCKRKRYRQEHGEPPPVEMMPSGYMTPEYIRFQ